MPTIVVTNSEVPPAGAGISASVGTLFLVGTAGEGPATGQVPYESFQSLGEVINSIGQRATDNAFVYDELDEFFSDGGQQAYFAREVDSTDATASLTLLDSGGHATVKVSALSPGAEGNTINIAVTSSAVEVEDSSGDVLESWPYSGSNSALLGVASAYVSFAQASGTGFTTNAPAVLAPAALSGGADPTDLTDANVVSTLALFPKALGPGTVRAPGHTSALVAGALRDHANVNNRWAVIDQADAATNASAIAAKNTILAGNPGDWSRCFFVQGSLVMPQLISGAQRVAAGGAAVAALRAQVAKTANSNKAPIGANWPLSRPNGFTTYYGAGSSVLANTTEWSDADLQAMQNAGINCFAVIGTTLCLYGFVSAVSISQDPIFWQAKGSTERMALTAQGFAILQSYVGEDIDDETLTRVHSDFATLIDDHVATNALIDGQVETASPVNTAASAQAGQLNAQVDVQITNAAFTLVLQQNFIPLTESLPTAA